ncbi:MAG: hypothetical protein LBH19_12615 [Dysgonamonadaceae bacterium]|jgi:hypothetical protein|nr:hypothetical protein [Dysgonamonadaceae bacterium]
MAEIFTKRNAGYLAVSLLLLNVFLLSRIDSFNKSRAEIRERMEALKGDLHAGDNLKLHAYKLNFEAAMSYDNLYLNDITVTDTLNNELKISDLFRDADRMLVARISETHCRDCAVYLVREMLRWAEQSGGKPAVFFEHYGESRNFNRLKANYGIGNTDAYAVPRLDIPAEKTYTPYFFVPDKTLRVSRLFIPEKTVPELTDKYLEIIAEKIYETSEGQN